MKIVALLPMKGHSERVPNKNLKLFAGQPLYHCIAGVLEESDKIESIVINTDSEIIAEDALKHFKKAKIVERPHEIRGDFVSMNKIINYDLSVCEGEHYIQTHSTNPLLKRETLENAIDKYFDSLSEYDSVFSVTTFQTRFYWASGKPVNHNPDELIRTQDLPPLFEENSNFYIFSKKTFKASGNKRIGRHPKMYSIDKLEAVDIDAEVDFRLAEVLFKLRKS